MFIWSRACVHLPRVSPFSRRSSILKKKPETQTLERMEAGGDEDGEKEAPAAGAQELMGWVPQLEAPHSQPSSPHGRRSRRGSGGERGGGVGSPPHAGPISRRVVRGGRPRPTALAAARGAAGRPRPTARGAGRGGASSPTGAPAKPRGGLGVAASPSSSPSGATANSSNGVGGGRCHHHAACDAGARHGEGSPATEE